MKRTQTTHLLLGIIAAEVVFLTMHALAARPDYQEAASTREDQPGAGKRPHSEGSGSLIRQALRQLGHWLFGPGRERDKQRARNLQGEHAGPDQQRTGSSRQGRQRAESSGGEEEENREARPDLRPGLGDKLKDAAWAGLLAANDGNVPLTQAERAVPMPGSAQMLGRLDKNPHVGKGMSDHSRRKV